MKDSVRHEEAGEDEAAGRGEGGQDTWGCKPLTLLCCLRTSLFFFSPWKCCLSLSGMEEITKTKQKNRQTPSSAGLVSLEEEEEEGQVAGSKQTLLYW